MQLQNWYFTTDVQCDCQPCVEKINWDKKGETTDFTRQKNLSTQSDMLCCSARNLKRSDDIRYKKCFCVFMVQTVLLCWHTWFEAGFCTVNSVDASHHNQFYVKMWTSHFITDASNNLSLCSTSTTLKMAIIWWLLVFASQVNQRYDARCY